MNERKVYKIVNGKKIPVSDDPIVRIEETCINRVGELRFTPHDEMTLFENTLTKSMHAKKTALEDYRTSAGLSLSAIAELIGMSKDGYYLIETGVSFPTLPRALRLAKLFGTTVEELFLVK